MSLGLLRQGAKRQARGHARRSRSPVCDMRLADVTADVGDARWLCCGTHHREASPEGERQTLMKMEALTPLLRTRHLKESVEFYTTVLGFQCTAWSDQWGWAS